MVRQLVDRFFNGLGAAVDDVAPLVLRPFDQILHETPESGKVGGYGGDTHLLGPFIEVTTLKIKSTHNCAFCRGITPRFVVTGKNTKMAAANKLFVIETKNRVV